MAKALVCDKAPAVIIIVAVVQPSLAHCVGEVAYLSVGSAIFEDAEVGVDTIQKVSEQGLGRVTAIPSVY